MLIIFFFFLRISRNTLFIVMRMRYTGRIRIHTARTERTAPETNNGMLCRLVTIRLRTIYGRKKNKIISRYDTKKKKKRKEIKRLVYGFSDIWLSTITS